MLRPITSRWLLLMALCLALTMAGLSVHWARTDLRETWGRVAEHDARVLAQLSQELARHVSLGDRVLGAIRDDWQDPGLQSLAPELRQRLLFKRLTGEPVFAATLVLDRAGLAVADSAGLVPRPVMATQRDYFQVQWRADRDALYISHPFVSQIKKIPALAMSRRLQDAAGHFAGVVVGLVPLAHWQGLLDGSELQGDSLLWLEHRDGTYLAGAVGPGGASLSGSLSWPEHGPQGPAPAGNFRSDLAGDGVPRLVSYLQVGDAPLRLVLMRRSAAVEAAWWQRVASTGGVTLVLVAGCLGLVLLFERELRHRQQVSQLLAHAEGHLRTIVNHLPSLVSYWDRDLRNLFANHLHRDLFGLLPEVLRGQTLPDVVGPALMHRYGPYIKLALAGEAQTFEWPVKLPGGLLRTLLVSLAPDLREGRVAGIFAQLMDITDRKQAESQVFEEKERFRVTLSSIGDAVITVDVAGRVTYLNPVAELMTDWRLDLARGEPVEAVMPIVNSVDGSPLRNPVRLALELQDTVGLAADTALVRRDGQRFDIEDSAAPIKDRHGEIIGAVMVFHDVSEMRSMAIRMAHLAQHDALTGLPNRLMLYDRAEQAILLAQREQEQVAVMYLDLDRFKTVNDSLGHEVGDRLLVDFARRLSSAMRHSDTLSRQGGDEFVILQTGLKDAAQAGQLARKLLRLCSEPFVVQGRELNVSVTIGIALFPADGSNFDELAKHADAALYAAKNAGRNRFHYFTRELGVAAHLRLQQEQALKAALGHGEIFLEYQPKVDFSADQVVGGEALAHAVRVHADIGCGLRQNIRAGEIAAVAEIKLHQPLLHLRCLALGVGPVDQAMTVDGVGLALHAVRIVFEPLVRRRGDHTPRNILVGFRRAEFLCQILISRNTFARHPRIEEERPPVNLDRHVAGERQRILDALLADIAPRAHHVGDDVDLQRLQGAHGGVLARECGPQIRAAAGRGKPPTPALSPCRAGPPLSCRRPGRTSPAPVRTA